MGLILLLLAVAASSSYVVLTDRRPLIHDPLSNVMPSALLRHAVATGETADWRRWLESTWYRPPLPTLVNLPAVLAMDDHVAAVRLTEVVVFLLLLLLLYDLGARLASPRAGLLAALLCAGLPLMQGWCRAGNADPLIWITLLLLLRVMLVLDLRSPWKAAALGLSVGLCLATRLLSLAFLVGPLLWLLLFQVRSWRSAVGLCASGVWAVAVIGWWYVAQFDAVYDNSFMSTADAHLQERTLMRYLETGSGWVFGGAAAAWVVGWRLRVLDRRIMALFGLWVLLPWLQFLFVWHIWE
ncbi:glycosyltransferase family 39 protein, partial [bacterium]|nr:glycosyltransferase family 39 protein [bacterium]